MLKDVAVQKTVEMMDGTVHTEQFELLRDFILDEYYRPDQIQGWKLSEMKRPDRKTVLRLIRFFLNEI